VGRAAVVEALQINDAVREAIAEGKPLADVEQVADDNRALVRFLDCARTLLQKQIISASEVLLSLAD
jgi:type II secretory ATPase GspE/PulE/Tfp pilus assembly ATPase PilB-like protein